VHVTTFLCACCCSSSHLLLLLFTLVVIPFIFAYVPCVIFHCNSLYMICPLKSFFFVFFCCCYSFHVFNSFFVYLFLFVVCCAKLACKPKLIKF
jgi:hypothetical protein